MSDLAYIVLQTNIIVCERGGLLYKYLNKEVGLVWFYFAQYCPAFFIFSTYSSLYFNDTFVDCLYDSQVYLIKSQVSRSVTIFFHPRSLLPPHWTKALTRYGSKTEYNSVITFLIVFIVLHLFYLLL